MRWHWTSFSELTVPELYAALQLRQAVFVLEQTCLYPDIDGDDALCHHLLGFGDDGGLDAYLRVYPPGALKPDVVIGRVIIAPRVRSRGLGRVLMETGQRFAFETFGAHPIYLGGQSYLRSFYESLGYAVVGPEYLEDDIPHFPMRRPHPQYTTDVAT